MTALNRVQADGRHHRLSFAEAGHYTRLASIRRWLDDPLIRDLAIKAHSSTPRGFLDQIKQVDPAALDREAEVYFERVLNEFADVKLPKPRPQTPLGESHVVSYSSCATSSSVKSRKNRGSRPRPGRSASAISRQGRRPCLLGHLVRPLYV